MTEATVTLSRENIAPRIITIIHNCLGVKMADITEEDSICDDLGADSLDYTGLWMTCEVNVFPTKLAGISSAGARRSWPTRRMFMAALRSRS